MALSADMRVEPVGTPLSGDEAPSPPLDQMHRMTHGGLGINYAMTVPVLKHVCICKKNSTLDMRYAG